MKIIILIFLFLLIAGCNKPKTVLICGDHICINKKEAKQYFEENLTIQVKILDKKVNNDINLVELNLKTNQQGKKEVRLLSRPTMRKLLAMGNSSSSSRVAYSAYALESASKKSTAWKRSVEIYLPTLKVCK